MLNPIIETRYKKYRTCNGCAVARINYCQNSRSADYGNASAFYLNSEKQLICDLKFLVEEQIDNFKVEFKPKEKCYKPTSKRMCCYGDKSDILKEIK